MSVRSKTRDELVEIGLTQVSMRPLFKRAVRDNMMFHCRLEQYLTFTPEQLALNQAKGQCLWGPAAWRLKAGTPK